MSNYSTRQTIAYEIGLTKQALLHHFGSKEKLYGAVLARISNQFEALRTNDAGLSLDPAARLKSVFMELLRTSIQRTSHTSILMRELLDNKRRADTAGTGYLASFLETLIALVRDVPAWRDASDTEALALIYQWLGAINYFAISSPTLVGIFGQDRFKCALGCFRQEFDEPLFGERHKAPNTVEDSLFFHLLRFDISD